jgi:flavin reductase (DIM6/NTAB) family NADH-FMN oxidoreductase RutF
MSLNSSGNDNSGSLDPRALRHAFGAFTTGVTVVTTLGEGEIPWGFTANSFTSVSLEPPLLLVCIAKTSGSFKAFVETGHFAVNVLASGQRETAMTFAAGGRDKFRSLDWRGEASGAPVLAGCVAWFDCAVEERIEAGDHVILLGRVLSFGETGEAPLAYGRGHYLSFELGRQALRAAEASGHLQVRAIVERGDTIFLLSDPATGELSLPSAPRFGRRDDPVSLIGLLAKEGVEARLPFLFAVFQEGDSEVVVYRGEAVGEIHNPGSSRRFFALDNLPWERMPDAALRTMLERYRRERETSAFGLYIGTAEEGSVQPLDEA